MRATSVSFNNVNPAAEAGEAEFFSAVSWAAIIAGAFAAAAVSLALMFLGSGIGLSVTPFWRGNSAVAFTVKTAVWMIIMQWIASAFGGYLTGRLRTKWTGIHSDEVFFRDTAHGFLTWAVATVITAAFLASALALAASGGLRAAERISSNGIPNSLAYSVDTLFRIPPAATPAATPTPAVAPAANDQQLRMEVARVLEEGVKNGGVSDEDRAYLAQMVAARTGVSPVEAAARVDAVAEKAGRAAEAARKSAVTFTFFVFFSMLIGAFIACVAAALGGRHRDELYI